VTIMAAVWQLDLAQNEKLVLLAFADHADDEGRCYPSIGRVAWKSGYSRRSVQRIVRKLAASGVLDVEDSRGGRSRPGLYRVVPEKGAKLTPFVAPERVTPATQRVTSATIKGDIAVSPQPSVNHQPNHQVRGRVRDLLWEVFVEIHGEPATDSERGKFNVTVKKLRDGDVAPAEYPILVGAYTTKYRGLQPAATTVAERIGELRHFVERGPIRSADMDQATFDADLDAWVASREPDDRTLETGT